MKDREVHKRTVQKVAFLYEGIVTYSRLMCTPAKKHYAGMLMAQEGIILKGDPERRLDMKGISLRKSSLNKKIRKYFEGTLINKILLPEKINLAEVYKDFNSISEEIVMSLLNGNTEYAYPGKVNSMMNYAAPYTIQTLRGTLLWNAIFPDRAINMPDKINYIKLKPIPYVEFVEKIPEEYRKPVIELYSKHAGKNGNKGLDGYDVSIICFPKSVKRIPDFLIPLIDKQTVVHDLLKAGIEIVEPLGFKKLDITDSSYTTNIINL